jgi:acyl-CoA synthetase (AMP-forming)/AMP-acid ligase II
MSLSDTSEGGRDADAKRRRIRRTARISLAGLNPMRVYERWETTAALMAMGATMPETPQRMVQRFPEIWRWRDNPASIVLLGAARHPDRPAIIDDDGEVSFGQLERGTTAIAAAWRSAGIGEESTVGVLATNGHVFVQAGLAAAKLGAHVVYLNGAFSAPQVGQVVQEEGIDVLVYDDELAPATALAAPAHLIGQTAIEAAAANRERVSLRPPSRIGRVILLTSGTTGRPKGAARSGAGSGNPLDAAGILTCIPCLPGEVSVVPAPLFHALGLFASNLTLALGGTVVLRRKFTPERTLEDIAAHDATMLIAVPLMLQRILELPQKRTNMFDTSSLRIVICGGAQLQGDLALRFMDRFGDILYNVYGSTETALATVALPRDLRAAPGTAGRPVPGVSVAVFDQNSRRAPAGVTGGVFVGSGLGFDGYTGGGSKERIGKLISTGDLGHMDRSGRLFIDGREDDMIISGGENVFPAEVEDLLSMHLGVAEVAVIGVPDEQFGQRLKAFVVLRPGQTVTQAELKAYVHDHLARFKTPREIVFVDSLPRTATGKILKRELRAA